MSWEPVIGLEIHVQLKTRTKMFCRCENGFGAAPNTQTCPVCLAFPGALPVPNRAAIEQTIQLGLALGCEIAERAVFHRKNYFYPDLPEGLPDLPVRPAALQRRPARRADRGRRASRSGSSAPTSRRTRPRTSTSPPRAASTAPPRRSSTSTAAGTPLLEIVTAPDLHSAEHAKRFLQLLRQTVVELGLSDAELDHRLAQQLEEALRVLGQIQVELVTISSRGGAAG